MTRYVLGLVIPLAVTGCLDAPVFGIGGSMRAAAPASPALVAECKADRSRHNTDTILAAALAGLAGTGGGAALIQGSDTTANVGRGVIAGTALAAGFAAGLVGGFSSVAANEYTASHCDAVPQP